MYAQIEGNEIKLYGTIWKGDGPYVVSGMSRLLGNAQEKVNIRLHTDGGSVFDGNMIANAINGAKADVTIYLDGLAASMGTILLMSGKNKAKAAGNAFSMFHAPSGRQEGNAKDFENTAKLLRSMEGNFTKTITAKSNLTEDEAKALMIGDNWFSADEMLTAGLIDEIYDAVLEESDLSAYQDATMCAQIFAKYNKPEDVNPPQPPTPIIPSNNQNEDEMKLTAESLTILGLPATATETEVNAAIAAQNKKIADIEAQRVLDLDAKCEKLVARGIQEGRILGGEKDAWLADAKANYELTERMMDKLPMKKVLPPAETPRAEAGTESTYKTFREWRKNDPQGLNNMKMNDPERYEQILQTR
jgi:ATP-dependent protease ClpP protease subunit